MLVHLLDEVLVRPAPLCAITRKQYLVPNDGDNEDVFKVPLVALVPDFHVVQEVAVPPREDIVWYCTS